MTVSTEEIELNTELQELYLKSKHLITDLGFLENKLDFSKKFAEKNFPQIIKFGDLDKIAVIMLNFVRIEEAQSELKNDILKYLRQMESLIIESDPNFDIGLIETYIRLEYELKEASIAFHSARSTLHHLIKQKTERLACYQ